MSEDNWVVVEERGNAGLITLNRPKALNALNLPMIRAITAALLRWKDMPHIQLVAIRGTGKASEGAFQPFGAFCAGGDIRFFHQAALAGDPTLEDFFTEEYSLNHLIHTYPKPYIAFMDGICMGGGMGISGHGGANSIRIVTERSKLAMPETMIGLFPDVGGGWFLSRCLNATPGMGEYLALTGELLTAQDAIAVGLADVQVDVASLMSLWEKLSLVQGSHRDVLRQITLNSIALHADSMPAILQNRSKIETYFGSGELNDTITHLQADNADWAQHTLAALCKRSPLMLHVTLELVRRARAMSLADDLRLERNLVRHCFHTQHLQRSGAATETAEGIRALAVDKDHAPKWNPAGLDAITPEMVQGFFVSPWPASVHPLRHL